MSLEYKLSGENFKLYKTHIYSLHILWIIFSIWPTYFNFFWCTYVPKQHRFCRSMFYFCQLQAYIYLCVFGDVHNFDWISKQWNLSSVTSVLGSHALIPDHHNLPRTNLVQFAFSSRELWTAGSTIF